jgi:hypothetical protein
VAAAEAQQPALELRIRVDCGAVARHDSVVAVSLPPEARGLAGAAGEHVLATTLVEEAGAGPGRPVTCQIVGGEVLTWVMAGPAPAGATRTYRCRLERTRGGGGGGRAGPVAVRQTGDHLQVTRDGALLARYVYAGVWKPYFWPVMTAAGNVVRGASAEHQHQTGLFLAYGGHGGPGTTNIWSDWDEPPYGPCGRMLHRGFDVVEGGPVAARFVQRLTYLRPDGEALLEETRQVRLVPLPGGDLVLDVEQRADRPAEAAPGPFILAARVADTLRLVDLTRRDGRGHAQALAQPGRLTGAAPPLLQNEANATYRTAGPWLDWSGPVGAGTAGIAFFDHPENPGYGQGVTAGGYGCMTLAHPAPLAAAGGPLRWRYRVLAHSGDAVTVDAARRFRDFAEPVRASAVVVGAGDRAPSGAAPRTGEE